MRPPISSQNAIDRHPGASYRRAARGRPGKWKPVCQVDAGHIPKPETIRGSRRPGAGEREWRRTRARLQTERSGSGLIPYATPNYFHHGVLVQINDVDFRSDQIASQNSFALLHQLLCYLFELVPFTSNRHGTNQAPLPGILVPDFCNGKVETGAQAIGNLPNNVPFFLNRVAVGKVQLQRTVDDGQVLFPLGGAKVVAIDYFCSSSRELGWNFLFRKSLDYVAWLKIVEVGDRDAALVSIFDFGHILFKASQ